MKRKDPRLFRKNFATHKTINGIPSFSPSNYNWKGTPYGGSPHRENASNTLFSPGGSARDRWRGWKKVQSQVHSGKKEKATATTWTIFRHLLPSLSFTAAPLNIEKIDCTPRKRERRRVEMKINSIESSEHIKHIKAIFMCAECIAGLECPWCWWCLLLCVYVRVINLLFAAIYFTMTHSWQQKDRYHSEESCRVLDQHYSAVYYVRDDDVSS